MYIEKKSLKSLNKSRVRVCSTFFYTLVLNLFYCFFISISQLFQIFTHLSARLVMNSLLILGVFLNPSTNDVPIVIARHGGTMHRECIEQWYYSFNHHHLPSVLLNVCECTVGVDPSALMLAMEPR